MKIQCDTVSEFMAFKNMLTHARERFDQRWDEEPDNQEQLASDMEFVNDCMVEVNKTEIVAKG
jgi:hypothetical protein